MNQVLAALMRWVGLGGALSERSGQQVTGPSAALVEDTLPASVDVSLQISTVYRCVELLSKVVGTLPLFVYERAGANGARTLARESTLWVVLHDSPNRRMTPSEFLMALMVNLLMRGNAYARIERSDNGGVTQLWPMMSDQVTPFLADNGELFYLYEVGSERVVFTSDQILHIKDIGNGTVGLSRIDYMRATTTEAARAQAQATRLFANGNKPTGLLTIDKVLNDEQRTAIRNNFAEIAQGSTSRLYVLEANMKFEQVSLTPEQVQLLETRQYTVEEICRWFGVPPVMVGHNNATAWGTGVEQILEGFYKVTVRPLLVMIEQAIAKRVLTPAQRARMTVEFNFDALLRASLKDRADIYAKLVQNGLKTRNECRQLENDPPLAGADELTAQSNLMPLAMLGKAATQGVRDVPQDPVAQ